MDFYQEVCMDSDVEVILTIINDQAQAYIDFDKVLEKWIY